MMGGNLPPGVSINDIPGNRPADMVFDTWMEGDIGEALMELAGQSLNDMADCHCVDAYGLMDDPDGTNPPGHPDCPTCHGSGLRAWPPIDVGAAVLAALRGIEVKYPDNQEGTNE